MKIAVAFTILFLAIACETNPDPEPKQEINPLLGKWKITEFKINGDLVSGSAHGDIYNSIFEFKVDAVGIEYVPMYNLYWNFVWYKEDSLLFMPDLEFITSARLYPWQFTLEANVLSLSCDISVDKTNEYKLEKQ